MAENGVPFGAPEKNKNLQSEKGWKNVIIVVAV